MHPRKLNDLIFSATARASRRRFLQFSAAVASSIALSNCQQNQSEESTATGSETAAPANSEPLHIYTWADYSNDEVYKRFTDETGIQVVADVYDSNETMLAKMQAGGGNQYSILYPSDYMVKQMIELNLLSEIDQAKLTGMDQLLDKWQNPPYDPNNTHSVPISWGTTGFIYNKKVLTAPLTDWNSLWEQREALSGKMTMLDDVREVMGATLKSLGYSYNSTNPQELEAAYQKLQELKPAVQSFRSFGWEDPLVAGDLVLAMTYSILGNAMAADNPDLDYVIPNSGTSVWTDTMTIPASAPNPEAAYAWINFMLEPENSAFAVEKLSFATPNKATIDRLPAELTQDTELFPTSEMLAKCEGIAPVGDATEIYDRYWTELKST